MPTRVDVLKEARHPQQLDDGWVLCLQWVRYVHPSPEAEELGYRFIWRRPNGSLQAARGQARIGSLADVELLMRMARDEGWGDLIG